MILIYMSENDSDNALAEAIRSSLHNPSSLPLTENNMTLHSLITNIKPSLHTSHNDDFDRTHRPTPIGNTAELTAIQAFYHSSFYRDLTKLEQKQFWEGAFIENLGSTSEYTLYRTYRGNFIVCPLEDNKNIVFFQNKYCNVHYSAPDYDFPCLKQLAVFKARLVQKAEAMIGGKLLELTLQALETRSQEAIDAITEHNAFEYGWEPSRSLEFAIDTAHEIIDAWYQYSE